MTVLVTEPRRLLHLSKKPLLISGVVRRKTLYEELKYRANRYGWSQRLYMALAHQAERRRSRKGFYQIDSLTSAGPFGGHASLSTSLEAYWKLDEESGQRVDSHGSNDLADNATVLFAAGKIGNAADFEKDNAEFLDIADNASLSMGDIDLTITLWVKTETQAATMGILSKYDNVTDDREYVVYWNQGTDRFVFGLSQDGTALTVTEEADVLGAVANATFYFVVCQHDSAGNLIKISVNDGAFDSQAYAGGVFDGAADFQIGGSDAGWGDFDGLVDEVGIWKKILSGAEITALYNGGSGLTY